MMSLKSNVTSFDTNIKQQAKEDPFDMFGDVDTNTKDKAKRPSDDFLDLI